MNVRVRFAPSPTGEIHIGNIRTAIFNWLYARKEEGTFILRIEDTDRERSTEEFKEIIFRELKWLGLDVDEGVGAGGGYGPYQQMERLEIYREYARILEQKGLAYPCFCSPEELETEREKAMQEGRGSRYSGKCRNLSPEKRARAREQKTPEALRFLNRFEGPVSFPDIIRGEISFEAETLDDFVLMKSDGSPTYNFACVIDDYTMEISHVIRGEDHISNTPKQILLYKGLGWELPEFAHLPLILDKDRRRMKKRSGEAEVFISRYRDMGYLPDAMLNYLALLGWSDQSGEEVLTREELIAGFSLERIKHSGAIFDREKLDWMNGVYIRKLNLEGLREKAVPFFRKKGIELFGEKMDYLLLALQEKVSTLEEMGAMAADFTGDLEYENREKAKEIFSQDRVDEVLKALQVKLKGKKEVPPEEGKGFLKEIGKELGVKGKLVFQPVRWALTGKGSGPDLNFIMAFLGPEEAVSRLGKALELRED